MKLLREMRIACCLATTLACSLAPAAAQATVSCTRDAGTAVVTVRANDESTAEIVRSDDNIVVRYFLGPEVSCQGATVSNTDLVRIDIGQGLFPGATIFLEGGPFAPGATPEDEGTSEIEFEYNDPGGNGLVEVEGTVGAEVWEWTGDGINLNPTLAADNDADVMVQDPDFSILSVNGAAGSDTITVARGLTVADVFSNGGPGRDVLTGDSAGNSLDGGPGGDRIVGGRGYDLISGGSGRDVVLAGRGSDEVSGRDGKRDRLRCGPGNDKVIADRKDSLKQCERVRGPAA